MDKNVMEKFYEDNMIDFRNDDELWNINQELHIHFLSLSGKIGEREKNILDTLYEQVFKYIDVSNRKNFYKAFSTGLYFKNNLGKDEG